MRWLGFLYLCSLLDRSTGLFIGKADVLPDDATEEEADDFANSDNSTDPVTGLESSQPHLFKREQRWLSQDNAVHELRVISTPPYMDWSCRTGYEYQAEAGEDRFIYHIEVEFDGRVEPPLKVPGYDAMPEKYRSAPDSHSTCVADKAMGKRYGVAKKARLIPVLLPLPTPTQFVDGLKRVRDDIKEDMAKDHPTRYKKSVVVSSLAYDKIHYNVDESQEPWSSMKSTLSELFDLGVPVVQSGGNGLVPNFYIPGQNLGVSKYPAYFAAEDFPIINAGSASANGRVIDGALRGPKITVFADAQAITCVGYDTVQTGSSFAAPPVAGGIAVFMSLTEGSFYERTKGKAGTRAFVEEVRKFIREEASYLQHSGARMFYNLNPE
ncbi:Subtilisin-like protein [Penicillium capsulatum]|uniref:Subtilisin-like protein n=1 Tax=Penicillium capsulatum TaxID=69766 RepID=A0A9W9LRB5_9EURO|nr:Subtilisin-like protein [Penicillium capsulatum]KAJ6135140.1 Subtilisin-like protein [Penicillium capsulatum]